MFGFNSKNKFSASKFLELTNQLAYAQDVQQLVYVAVDFALNNLGFDRLGILLYDEKNKHMQGTWGTDRYGEIRNEQQFYEPINEIMSSLTSPSLKGELIYNEKVELWDNGDVIGTGWHATIIIFDKEVCLGWILADNLVSKQALTDDLRESLNLFGAVVGLLLVRLQFQNQIYSINQDLTVKNQFLEKTMDKLSIAQQQIVESEKMSALGKLANDVVHELVEPMDDNLKLMSDFRLLSDDFFQKYLDNKLQPIDYQKFHQKFGEYYNSINQNFLKSTSVLKPFQSITTDKDSNETKIVNVEQFFDELIVNLKSVYKAGHHEFILICEPNISATLYTGKIYQLFNQLLSNSLTHGFKTNDIGIINIIVKPDYEKSNLAITYSDNGQGSTKELNKLYNPFDSSNKNKGAGLGTFIIYNLVVEQMQGTIHAEQPDNDGLRYHISIPCTQLIEESH